MRARKRRTSNVVLAVLGAFLLAFEVCMIALYWIRGSVPDALIQYTLGAGGVEALVLAAIKVSKVLAGDRPGGKVSDGDTERKEFYA